MSWLSIPHDEQSFAAAVRSTMNPEMDENIAKTRLYTHRTREEQFRSSAKALYAKTPHDFMRFALAFPRQAYLLDQLHRIYKNMDDTLELVWTHVNGFGDDDFIVRPRRSRDRADMPSPPIDMSTPFTYFLSASVSTKQRSCYLALNSALRDEGMRNLHRPDYGRSRSRSRSRGYRRYNTWIDPSPGSKGCAAWFEEVAHEVLAIAYRDQRKAIVEELMGLNDPAEKMLVGGTFWEVTREIAKREELFARSMERLEAAVGFNDCARLDMDDWKPAKFRGRDRDRGCRERDRSCREENVFALPDRKAGVRKNEGKDTEKLQVKVAKPSIELVSDELVGGGDEGEDKESTWSDVAE